MFTGGQEIERHGPEPGPPNNKVSKSEWRRRAHGFRDENHRLRRELARMDSDATITAWWKAHDARVRAEVLREVLDKMPCAVDWKHFREWLEAKAKGEST